MDDARFDALSRAFSTAYSRRGFGRLLGGVTAGSLLTGRGAPRVLSAKRIGGTPCKKGKQCLTHKCVGPKGQKRCTCSEQFPACVDSLACSGGVCAEEPDCLGVGNCIGSPLDCCSGICILVTQETGACGCSAVGRPCLNTSALCCPDAQNRPVSCIGFYCGGCRGKNQPCDDNGGGCCGQLLCQGGICQEPVIGG